MAGKRTKRAEQATRMKVPCYRTRRKVVIVSLFAIGLVMVFGAIDRQIFQKEFLQKEGDLPPQIVKCVVLLDV